MDISAKTYGVLVTRKSGEVDSLAIIKSGYSSRADAKALPRYCRPNSLVMMSH
jgi:hypothetical protein